MLALLQDPIIGLTVGSLVLITLWLLFAPSYTPKKPKKRLPKEEEDKEIAQWTPKPIVPPTFKPDIHQVASPLVVKSHAGAVVIDENDHEYLNFGSANYLGLASLQQLKDIAKETIIDYGVGSCGPRGFYGTIDLHLQLENTWSKFMGSPDSILYSDGMACLSSVIPAFSKAGDYIIVDEMANCGIQQGLKLSRSKIVRFEHNNIESLEQQLINNDKAMSDAEKVKHRRFIIVESIYQKTGSLCPLDKVVALAKKYKFRVILDDSNAVGVLGATGRGALEQFNLKLNDDVAIVCTTLDTTLSSVGGLCVGTNTVVSHQRLAGSGYCFSAASPPYTARVATQAIGLVENNPALIQKLQTRTKYAFELAKQQLSKFYDVSGSPNSPIIVFRPSAAVIAKWSAAAAALNDQKKAAKHEDLYVKLKKINSMLRDEYAIIIPVQHRAPQEEPYPWGLKFSVSVLHSEEDIQHALQALVESTERILA